MGRGGVLVHFGAMREEIDHEGEGTHKREDDHYKFGGFKALMGGPDSF